MIKPKKDTNRIAKVNSLIEHSLGPFLHEFLDFQKGLVTISKVETSRDMKWAKVWISILPTDSPRLSRQVGTPSPKGRGEKSLSQAEKQLQPALSLDDKILKYINSHIYEIQGELNKNFHTKVIPRISFFLDTAPRYVEHIEEVIKKIHNGNDINDKNDEIDKI